MPPDALSLGLVDVSEVRWRYEMIGFAGSRWRWQSPKVAIFRRAGRFIVILLKRDGADQLGQRVGDREHDT